MRSGIRRKKLLCWGMIASLMAGMFLPSVGTAAAYVEDTEGAKAASSDAIYADLEFSNPQEWGLSDYTENGNSTTWEEDTNNNGYLKLNKTTTKDMLIQINNMELTSQHVVFEQDIYLEEAHPNVELFWLREGDGSPVSILTLNQNHEAVLTDHQVALETGQWYRLSAVMDFENHLCDIYVNGTPAIEDVAFNTGLNSPTLWRIYVPGGDATGAFYSDNLRVYDGTKPRDIEWEKEHQTVYHNLQFDDSEPKWGLSDYTEGAGPVTQESYLKLNKTATDSSDMLIQINNMELTSQHVVFEQDIYLEEAHPTMEMMFREGNKAYVVLLRLNQEHQVVGDKDERTATLETNKWHRLSAAMDFENHLCDIYVDGVLVIEDLAFSDILNRPTLWRIYVPQGEATGAFYIDNLSVYDGTEPRDITEAEEQQEVYYNLRFEDSQPNWGLSDYTDGAGSVTWESYLKLNKTATDNSDMLIQINNMELASQHIVFEQDIYLEETHPNVELFWLRQGSGGPVSILTLNQDHEVVLADQKVGLETEQWYRLSAVMDFEDHLCDIYVNGTLEIEGVPFNADLNSPTLWRIYVPGNTTTGAFYSDNLRVYDGMRPRNIDVDDAVVEEHNVFSDADALAVLNGKTALSPYGGVLYANGQKQDVSDSLILEGEEALVTPAVMEKLFGVTVTVEGNKATIGNVVLEADKKEITIDGVSTAIAAAPRLVEGTLYLPVSAYGEHALAEGCFYDDGHGMLLVSGQAINTADSRLKEANLYLFFERKSSEELKEMLLAANGEDLAAAHPRILATAEDFERLREEISTDSTKAAWFDYIKTSADGFLEQEPLEYVISNSRLLDVSNAALIRTANLGMAWQITGEQKYADRLIEELLAIGSFQDWHPEHTLDTGTMAMAAAIGYDWAYDAMTEEQRELLGEQFWSLGLETAREAYYGTAAYQSWWTKTETNWGGVVNAGFLNLALALAERDPDYAMDIVANAKRSMEYTIYRIAPDGAWYEGPSYWQYFFQFLSYALAGYESALGETDETLSFMGMESFAKYQMYFSDPSGNVNNFHDSEEGAIGSYGQFYLADKLNISGLAEYRVNFMEQQNTAPTVYDLLWYDIDGEGGSETDSLPLDGYYRETEFFSMRQNWEDENALWVSAHGGSTNAAHDHIDSGTFVLNLGGTRWAIDLPKEMLSYVSDAENPSIQAGYNSYYFYRRKGEGHNIVVINPDSELEMDQSQFAKVTEMVSGTGRSYAVIDLSGAYQEDVNSYLRGYLVSEGRRAFTVRDEIDLKEDNSELYWFLHTEGQVVIQDDQTAVILQDGKQLKVQFATDAEDYELSVMAAEKLPTSPQFEETANPKVSKLALKLTGSGKVNITVKMSLMGEEPSLTGPEDTPIAEWTVEGDDTISAEGAGSAARISELRINGQPLDYFLPETFYYEYSLGETEESAEITADGTGRVEVVTYPLADDCELKEVRVYDDAGKYTSYVLKILPYDPYSQSQYIRHDVVEVWGSKEQTDEPNYFEGSADGDLGTRWSAEGIGEYVVHDLGEEKTIDAFGVALWMGAQRNFYFDLEISNDGVNFTPVVKDYVSSGTTEDIEIIPLEESVTARYVRYMGYGNSVNAWNNVIELASYIKRDSVDTGDEGGETPGGDSGDEGGETPGGDPGDEGGQTPGGSTGDEGGQTPGGSTGDEGGQTPGGNTGDEGSQTPGGNTGSDGGDAQDGKGDGADAPKTGEGSGANWALYVLPLMLVCILALIGLGQMKQRFFGRR